MKRAGLDLCKSPVSIHFFKGLFTFYFIGVNSLPVCTYVPLCVPGALRDQMKGIECPRLAVIDGCEVPCGCCKPNSGPLQVQSMFLSTDLLF